MVAAVSHGTDHSRAQSIDTLHLPGFAKKGHKSEKKERASESGKEEGEAKLVREREGTCGRGGEGAAAAAERGLCALRDVCAK